MTFSIGTTPDDHFGIYADGVLWLVIVSETGEAKEGHAVLSARLFPKLRA